MLLPTPSYTFVTSGGQRHFFHRWQFENNKVIECNKCGTTCKQNDAYSKHWKSQKTQQDKIIKTIDGNELNTWTRTTTGTPPTTKTMLTVTKTISMRTTLMEYKQVIVSNNIESFMLCNDGGGDDGGGKVKKTDTQQFLLDAGIKVIPELLNALYAMPTSCKELLVTVRFYVEIKDEMFMLQTSELEIKHYFDIRESVDMIFLMLLEKMRTFMTTYTSMANGKWRGSQSEQQQQLQPHQYKIKRMNIKVKRILQTYDGNVTLPLQYKRKHALLKETETKQHNIDSKNNNNNEELLAITTLFKEYLNTNSEFNPPISCNLYCFQICQNSQELYAVPYHLSDNSFLHTRNFIILNDILGNFLELQEIFNIKRFLHHHIDDQVLVCPFCQSKFMEPNRFLLHRMLNCANDFKFEKVDKDFIEIYENCYELLKCSEGSLFGIVE